MYAYVMWWAKYRSVCDPVLELKIYTLTYILPPAPTSANYASCPVSDYSRIQSLHFLQRAGLYPPDLAFNHIYPLLFHTHFCDVAVRIIAQIISGLWNVKRIYTKHLLYETQIKIQKRDLSLLDLFQICFY